MGKLQKYENNVRAKAVKDQTFKILGHLLNLLNIPYGELSELIQTIENSPLAIRLQIFVENFETYLAILNGYNENTKEFNEDNLKKLKEALLKDISSAEVEDPSILREYAKRIIKMIDDCGSVQKANYLADIAKALINDEIDKREFFKLSHCINSLIDEDLTFLKSNVEADKFVDDGDFIDEFVGLGLMYQADDGYTYSLMAFKLVKYGLSRSDLVIPDPDKFPERHTPLGLINIAADEANQKADKLRKQMTWNKLE